MWSYKARSLALSYWIILDKLFFSQIRLTGLFCAMNLCIVNQHFNDHACEHRTPSVKERLGGFKYSSQNVANIRQAIHLKNNPIIYNV